jgi:hypothetical protein
MAKHDDNAVIFMLCVVIFVGIVLTAFLLLRLLTVDAALRHNKREVDKAIVLLREEREKLKAVRTTEKGNE